VEFLRLRSSCWRRVEIEKGERGEKTSWWEGGEEVAKRMVPVSVKVVRRAKKIGGMNWLTKEEEGSS